MADKLSNGEEVLTLANLNGGRAVALFEIELQRVLDNIADINAPAKAKRAVKLVVTFKPDETRKIADVYIDCESKIASNLGGKTQVHMGKHQGRNVAVDPDVSQDRLFETKPNLHKVNP